MMKEKNISKWLWLFVLAALSAVFSCGLYAQIDITKRTVTLDSLSSRQDTIWLTNGAGSVIYLRTSGDSLYFGDLDGEKNLGQLSESGIVDLTNATTGSVLFANGDTISYEDGFRRVSDTLEVDSLLLIDLGTNSFITTRGKRLTLQSGAGQNLLLTGLDDVQIGAQDNITITTGIGDTDFVNVSTNRVYASNDFGNYYDLRLLSSYPHIDGYFETETGNYWGILADTNGFSAYGAISGNPWFIEPGVSNIDDGTKDYGLRTVSFNQPPSVFQLRLQNMNSSSTDGAWYGLDTSGQHLWYSNNFFTLKLVDTTLSVNGGISLNGDTIYSWPSGNDSINEITADTFTINAVIKTDSNAFFKKTSHNKIETDSIKFKNESVNLNGTKSLKTAVEEQDFNILTLKGTQLNNTITLEDALQNIDSVNVNNLQINNALTINYDSLIYSDTVYVNFNDGNSMKRKMLVTGNSAVYITGLPVGGECVYKLIVDGTGGYTLSLNVTAGSVQKQLTTSVALNNTANTTNIIKLEYDGYEVNYENITAQ